jgi:hypothetical protein
MNAEALIESLASFAEVLPGALAGLTEADAHVRPSSGAWSVVEILNHLLDEETDDFRRRLELTLRDPAHPWPPNDPESWARDRKYNERSTAESLARFIQERRESLRWLRSLGPQDWGKAHTHPKAGPLAASS